MKLFSYTVTFLSFIFGLLFFSLNHNLKKEIAYKDVVIENLENKLETLEEKQKSIDWLESELSAIDKYISVIDQLRYAGNVKFPELQRTQKELNEARCEVIKNAVYWDRVINSWEESEND